MPGRDGASESRGGTRNVHLNARRTVAIDISSILSKHASDTLLISSTKVLQQFRESKNES
ncbi:hypothetical protein PsorP6_007424 [Peronosclerospora sorghi]|uniref:Uncharacterized protein n=1 Tax=Peronosclerospora sorghi TaxID=230839 RepID=A0ACC0WDD7_9STRA|nr:hypothetical protein PsorP6_007424 [Peronosclerospora sorghi]